MSPRSVMRGASGPCWRPPIELVVRTRRTAVVAECDQLTRQVDEVPRKHTLKVFAGYRADRSFGEKIQNRGAEDDNILVDLRIAIAACIHGYQAFQRLAVQRQSNRCCDFFPLRHVITNNRREFFRFISNYNYLATIPFLYFTTSHRFDHFSI